MMCIAYLISSGESETYEALIVPSFPIWWNQDFTQVTSRFDLKSKIISLSSKCYHYYYSGVSQFSQAMLNLTS